MKNLAVIPARGGSKRIPRKNIRMFLGKPIIQYSIEAAIDSNLFDEIMVSTDDQEIAAIARSLGAKVPFMRSADNANDFATIADVINEVLNNFKQEVNKTFDNVCCIFATSPFSTTEKLVEAFEIMTANNYDATFPVSKFSYPIMRALQIDEGNRVSMIWPEYLKARSQDLPAAYHDCGQFYWANVLQFQKYQTFFTPNTGVIELAPTAFQDIDNEEDWKIAEIKFEILRNRI